MNTEKKFSDPAQPAFLRSMSFAKFLLDFSIYQIILMCNSYFEILLSSLVLQSSTMVTVLTRLTRARGLIYKNCKDFICFKDKFDVLHNFIVISCAFCPC